MTIELLRENKSFFEQIIELHRKNAKTLGFLPEVAFKIAMYEERIIIARENDKLFGYCLIMFNKRSNYIVLTHLCISKEYRNKGIAKGLINYLRANYERSYKGIRVKCRSDYEATKFWEKIGFTYMNEVKGKSKKGSVLIVWWYNFNEESLFSIYKSKKIIVALDSMILFHLMEPESLQNQSSHMLMADWLDNEIEYFFTSQVKNDISHNTDPFVRAESMSFLSNYKILNDDQSKFEKTLEELKSLYSKKELNKRDESDLMHLARAINSDAKYFLTFDNLILEHSDVISLSYNLEVLEPATFMIRYSSIINEIDFNRYRLLGSKITKKCVDLSDLKEIVNVFHKHTYEKKRVFEKKIKTQLLDDQEKTYIIKNGSSSLLFYAYSLKENNLHVNIFRYIDNNEGRIVTAQIIMEIIHFAVEQKVEHIILYEFGSDSELEFYIQKLGFLKIEDKFVKKIFTGIYSQNEFLNKYNSIGHLTINIDEFRQLKVEQKMELEEKCYPAKISDAGIPCFLVPIRPNWAMNLFESQLAAEDLFGGESNLLLNYSNVYYRSARQKILRENSRILWYISCSSRKKYLGTKAITASSIIKNIEIGPAKSLFNKFRHLGIYKWEDILQLVDYQENKEIMAFKFERTEVFSNMLESKEINKIFNQFEGKDFSAPQSPLCIKEKTFMELYSLGVK